MIKNGAELTCRSRRSRRRRRERIEITNFKSDSYKCWASLFHLVSARVLQDLDGTYDQNSQYDVDGEETAGSN